MKISSDFEDEWRKRFRRYADRYDDDAGIAGWSPNGLESRFRYFKSLWSKTHTVSCKSVWLDAGCGAGTYTRYLSSMGCDVVGIDYSHGSIAKARIRSDGTPAWLVADVRQLPFRSESCVGAISFGVVQALSSSEKLISELTFCVRGGGEIWVDALNIWCLPNLWDAMMRRLKGRRLHVRYESPASLKRLFRKHGIRDIEVYWVPVIPSGFPRLSRLMESDFIRRLFNRVPALGALVCHSVLVRGVRPSGVNE